MFDYIKHNARAVFDTMNKKLPVAKSLLLRYTARI